MTNPKRVEHSPKLWGDITEELTTCSAKEREWQEVSQSAAAVSQRAKQTNSLNIKETDFHEGGTPCPSPVVMAGAGGVWKNA